jgi:hypothetical protein
MQPLAAAPTVARSQAAGTNAAASPDSALLCGPTDCPATRVVAAVGHGELGEDEAKLLQGYCQLHQCMLTV